MKIVRIQNKSVTLGQLWENSKALSTVVDKDGGETRELELPIRVKTPSGSQEVRHIYRCQGSFVRITFDNGIEVRSLPTHRFMGEDGWILVKDISVGTRIRSEDGSFKIVTALEREHLIQDAFDIEVPEEHCYYANGLLSHNSLLMNQLALNQARGGYKVLVVPLEMDEREITGRMIANVSGLDNTKILLKRNASGESDMAWRKWSRFEKKVRAAGGRLTIFKPKEDMTIQEIMAAIHSYNADAIYIDYISLLKGADGEDQWRQLGAIARYGKIYAGNHNKVVALLAQVGEDGRLRYSQAVKEHASLAWSFVANKETRELGYISIEQFKARNQVMFPFTLKVDYSTQRVRDLAPEEIDNLQTAESNQAQGKARKGFKNYQGKGKNIGEPARAPKEGKSSDYMPDLAE